MNVKSDENVTPKESAIVAEETGRRAAISHSRLPYLPGIDGLRAIAVLAVMFYHAELPWMPGGFLGVEVFFGISGYLITGLLVAEWRKNGSINLGRFWFRRARRLLPAVFVLLLAVLLYAVLFLPNEVASLRSDVLAAAVYVSNWYQVFSHKSYFEAIGRPPLLRHLWSLAVEEQFYLLWPLLVAAALRWLHPRRQIVFTVMILGLAVASSILMMSLYQPDLDPSRVYYGTDTRAAGFLIGAALAMLLTPRSDSKAGSLLVSAIIDIAGVLALIGLIVSFVKLDEINPYLYLGGFTLVSLLTAVVISSVVRDGAFLMPGILGNRVLTWIGLRSYSIYLWHWPIFDVTRPHLDIALDGTPLLILRFVLTFICADLSYRFIERPIRDGALGRIWKRLTSPNSWKYVVPWITGVGASLLMVIFLGISVVNAKPAEIPLEYADSQPTSTPKVLLTAARVVAVTPRVLISPTRDPLLTLTVTPNITFTLNARSTGAPYLPPWPYSLISPTQDQNSVVNKVTPAVVSDTAVTTLATVHTITQTTIVMPSVITVTMTPIAALATPGSIFITQSVTDVLGANYKVLAVGDSVMLGASLELQQVLGGVEVDAVVSRQAIAAIALLKQRRDAGTLGDIVILHIGSNGYVTQKQFEEMMQILSNVRMVAVVDVRVPRRWEGPNNMLFAESIKRVPNAVLVDWFTASDSHPEIFTEDGVHLQPPGRRYYAQTILTQIKASEGLLFR